MILKGRGVYVLQLRYPNPNVQVLLGVLGRLPTAIDAHLHLHVFPLTMAHSGMQLSTSGQDLGGDLLFPLRLAFSGTPSDLLPRALGRCRYAPGDDARMVHVLTDPQVVAAEPLAGGWSVALLLDRVAAGQYHALIDTGALVTGLSNLQVAAYLT